MKKDYARQLFNKTREDYNVIAKDFSRTRRKPWPELWFLFNNYLEPGDRVLDLGCGNGRYFPFFEEKGVEYFGVDSSLQLIELAEKRHPKANFKKENGLGLSFPSNFFDQVYSIAVLHQIPGIGLRIRFLKEVKRVLRPRGLMILTVWSLYRRSDIYEVFKNILLKMMGKSSLDWRDAFISWGQERERYYHFFSQEELRTLVKKVGFNPLNSGIVEGRQGSRRNIYLVAEKPPR